MPITTNGPVATGTRSNLIAGLRSDPMDAEAVDAILDQAVMFTQEIVLAYESQVATGEVGANGSARASEDPVVGARSPTALLYGKVQSGKTAAMILTSALCLDNGFRIVIVLTADSVALVNQTADRFKDLDGPRVFSTVTDDQYEWEGREAEIEEDVPSDGIVLVCAKNALHLPRVIQFLQQIGASEYPAIVFDDEADAATPDTTIAARAAGRPTAPNLPSTIHRRVIENIAPGEEGESVAEILPHSIYVQVTATPYVLFLQQHASPIRPTVSFLLDPGDGYCGGETFFASFDPSLDEPEPPIVLVPSGESVAIARPRIPQGLAESIDFFLIAAAAALLESDTWPRNGFKHLSHTSVRINQHAVVAAHIERHLMQRRRSVRANVEEFVRTFAGAHAELRRTCPDSPALADLYEAVTGALKQAEVIVLNATTGSPTYGPRVNFLIGGNILGRGLTIGNLLVTYYLREARTSQMDTVWQHARMYGYRSKLLPYTRVYLPRRLAIRFRDIHETEEQLRELLRSEKRGENVPIRVALGSRATRPNAVDPNRVQVFRADLNQIYPHFIVEDAGRAGEVLNRLSELSVPIQETERRARVALVPVDEALAIVDAVPVQDDDPGRWSAESVRALMESFRRDYDDSAPIYVRRLEAEDIPPRGWIRGRLSGPEIELIRNQAGGVPALALMLLGDTAEPRGWYPTLVLPADRATYVVNPT